MGRLVLAFSPETRAAVRAGAVRLHILSTFAGTSLPSSWALPVTEHDIVLVSARLPPDLPCEGVVAIVVRRVALPVLKLDDEARERLAEALADALLHEVHR
jgi:hypothetical protein